MCVCVCVCASVYEVLEERNQTVTTCFRLDQHYTVLQFNQVVLQMLSVIRGGNREGCLHTYVSTYVRNILDYLLVFDLKG